MAGEVIARMIQEAASNVPSDTSDIIFGVVQKVNPLEILVDDRYTITQDLMVLMSPVKEKILSFTVNDVLSRSSGSVSYVTDSSYRSEGSSIGKSSATFLTGVNNSGRTINLTVFEALKKGERVSMIKGQRNQLYYVLDRA